MTSHTTGPWVVDDGVDSIENMADCLLCEKDAQERWIAVGVEDEDGYSESLAYCHPANALLISKAPEMFQLLQEAFNVLMEVPWGGSRCQEHGNNTTVDEG